MRSVPVPLDPYAALRVAPDADQAVVRAAYRALAWTCHPDRNPGSEAALRMRQINAAYDLVRTPERRSALLTQPDTARSKTAAAAATTDPSAITFGRYAGWTIAQLARHDPDYLRWLSRHSAGQPYRREIAERLEAMARPASHPTPAARRWAFFGG